MGDEEITMEMRKSELNDTEHTKWGAANTVLRGKVIALFLPMNCDSNAYS